MEHGFLSQAWPAGAGRMRKGKKSGWLQTIPWGGCSAFAKPGESRFFLRRWVFPRPAGLGSRHSQLFDFVELVKSTFPRRFFEHLRSTALVKRAPTAFYEAVNF
jgi:hypothetical protein